MALSKLHPAREAMYWPEPAAGPSETNDLVNMEQAPLQNWLDNGHRRNVHFMEKGIRAQSKEVRQSLKAYLKSNMKKDCILHLIWKRANLLLE